MLEITDLRTSLIGPIDLTIDGGECIAVMGPSGSGKSLMLRAIADLDPNEGDVRLAGISRHDIPAYDWRHRVGYVPAESGWWADHVSAHFMPDAATTTWLEAVGLPEARDWEVQRLSSGERQRLAIARMLQLAPKALLLDEPTSALDDTARDQIESLIDSQRREGRAILLVTHDRAQAGRLASRIFEVKDGRLSPTGER